MKALQYFSQENLKLNRDLSPDQVLQFLDDFRRLHGSQPSPSRLISMKVPEDLLNAFKTKAKLTHTPYQAQIKVLMKNWVLSGGKS
jgi:predicted DNA binding CopG/RHH family protein